MSRVTSAPLLPAVRVLLLLFVSLLVIGLILVALGLVAVLTEDRAKVVAKIAAEGMPPATYWGVVAGLVGVLVMFSIGLRFLLELKQIVASVNEGDPFVAENATRLSRMGWLALTYVVLLLPLSAAAHYLDQLTVVKYRGSAFSVDGILLVLTLFILARVFRKGAEMREDLEGTV